VIRCGEGLVGAADQRLQYALIHEVGLLTTPVGEMVQVEVDLKDVAHRDIIQA